MEKPIDEIIRILDDMKVKIDIPKAAVMQNNKNYALDVAIDTMRKYQKIEQILDDCDLEAWEVLEMIRKAVEDG